MDQIRRYLSQRDEHKGPFAEVRMRYHQIIFLQNLVTVKQDVNVYLPRAPSRPGASPQALFDPLGPRQQLAGTKMGLDLSYRVQEIVLVRPAPRRCKVKAR